MVFLFALGLYVFRFGPIAIFLNGNVRDEWEDTIEVADSPLKLVYPGVPVTQPVFRIWFALWESLL